MGHAPSIAAIILAAGLSRRFRENNTAPSVHKLAAMWKGQRLIDHAVTAAVSSKACPIYMVTNSRTKVLAQTLMNPKLQIIFNDDPHEGISRSLKLAINSLPDSVDGSLILLGDMPAIRPDTLDRLIDHFNFVTPKLDAIIPTFRGKRGNPVLLGRRLFSRINQLEGDQGARQIIVSADIELEYLALNDVGILRDVDTIEDLSQLDEEIFVK